MPDGHELAHRLRWCCTEYQPEPISPDPRMVGYGCPRCTFLYSAVLLQSCPPISFPLQGQGVGEDRERRHSTDLVPIAEVFLERRCMRERRSMERRQLAMMRGS